MIDVVVCDDHTLVRRGIRDTLAEASDIRVTGEAGSYAQAREVLREVPCQVLVLDINLPGRSGLELLQTLRDENSPVRVLIVSMYEAEQYALRCMRAGAWGYLDKAGDSIQLVAAVRGVAMGRKFITPEVAQLMADSISAPQEQAGHAALSEREMQTLVKIASGKRLSEIADELLLSPKTVSVYRARVLEKLKLGTNADLAVYATRHKLI